MIKDFKPRSYQESIFKSASKDNTLVVLPTGLGKTVIALLLAAHRLSLYSNSKILILAPTRPLVEQHLKTFKKHFNLKEEEIVLFTGFVKPEKRVELFEKAKIIISTPQGLENDILSNRLSLNKVSLLVVDEAHRAVKDYAYVFVAKQYEKKADHSRILALTASPGSEMSKVEEVCTNLFVQNIEIRTETDPDIKPHVQDVEVKWFEVDFPENFGEVKVHLETAIKRKVREVKDLGYFSGDYSSLTKTALLTIQAELRGLISSGEKSFEILKSISLLAEIMKIQHGLELLESQGLEPLQKYLEKLEDQAKTTTVKAVKNLVSDTEFTLAKMKVETMISKGIIHPKIKALEDIVVNEKTKNPNVKIIIFTQYRSGSSTIQSLLEKQNISSKMFIGQGKSDGKGLSQKEQKQIIDEFSNGDFNCLISTSVGEEGLDIPQVDLVIFYEPVPSAIRTIQRRGRTGRLEKGKVFILMTRKTRDEAYRWSAFHKEKKMHANLIKLKNKFSNLVVNANKEKNSNLDSYAKNNEPELKVVVDYREKGSRVMKRLSDDNVILDLKSLSVGDYRISDDVVIEFKTKKDFVDSIIDGRILHQAKDLTQFLKPIIMIEGDEDIYSQRNINQNAIRGMISTLTTAFKIPIIFTKNPIDSAEYIKLLAKRELNLDKKEFQMHSSKPLSLKEQQEYFISSLPGIGTTLAKPLLEKFGSPSKILSASELDLTTVDLVGNKKSKKIREVIDSKYI